MHCQAFLVHNFGRPLMSVMSRWRDSTVASLAVPRDIALSIIDLPDTKDFHLDPGCKRKSYSEAWETPQFQESALGAKRLFSEL